MIPVSDAYKLSIQKSFRNRSFVKVTLGAFDVTASTDANFSSTVEDTGANLDAINTDFRYEQSYATWEQNFFKLDGTQYIKPVSGAFYKAGFISTELCGSDSIFVAKPSITVDFSEPHDMAGFTLNFDTIENDFPVAFDIVGYKNNAVKITHSITDNNTPNFARVLPTADVDKVVFIFNKMNRPNIRLRVNRLMFGLGLIFDNNSLVSTSQQSNSHPLSMELPSYSLDFTVVNTDYQYDIDNIDGIQYFLQADQDVVIQYGYNVSRETGDIEWITAGNYKLDKWSTSKTRLEATFNCKSVLDNFTDTYYKGVFGTTTLYDLAVAVFTDMGYTKYRIDPYLKTVTTNVPLPIVSHKECLQLIANAGKCTMIKSTDDYISLVSQFEPKFTVSAQTEESYSNVQNILTVDPLSEYAEFDKDTFRLDGTQYLFTSAPPYKVTGFVSQELSDGTGVFVTKPKVTIEFEAKYSSYGMALQFNEVMPKTIGIKAYDGATLKYDYTATVTNKEFKFNRLLADVTKIEIVWFNSWQPYQRARLDKFLGFGMETDFVLSYNSIYGLPQGEVLPVLKSVNINLYNYSLSNTVDQLYNETFTVNGTEVIRIDFQDAVANVTASIVGGTVSKIVTYAQCAIVTVVANGEVTLTLNGNKYTLSNTMYTKSVNPKGEIVEVDNPLVTTRAQAIELADWVSVYASKRQKYNIDYRGNPEVETNDIIYLQTRHSGDVKADVISHTIAFDGALSGNMIVRANI